MKLFNIVLVGAVLLFTLQANAQIPKNKNSNTKENAKNIQLNEGVAKSSKSTKIYGEVTLTEVSGNPSVKVYFDPIMERMMFDNDAFALVTNIKKHRFYSLGEALNVLSSHGWRVEMVWTSLGRTGEVQHFLISNSIRTIPPISPWLEKKSSRDVTQPYSKGGRN